MKVRSGEQVFTVTVDQTMADSSNGTSNPSYYNLPCLTHSHILEKRLSLAFQPKHNILTNMMVQDDTHSTSGYVGRPFLVYLIYKMSLI